MAQPTTTRGGKVQVQLGKGSNPIVYTTPCGFTQRSVTLSKGLEEVQIPDCDDPDAINWMGRDAVSLSMAISGEGLAAEESIEDWLEASESEDSVPVKVIWEFPTKDIVWTGNMHVETFEAGGANGRRVTNTVSMQSDGKMTRVVS